MGRLVKNKGMVTMSKGDVTHEFVLESVPVWEAKGWSRVDDSVESEPSAVAVLLQDAAKESTEVEDPDAKVHEALSNEAKAVTGPSTKKKN